MHENLTNLVWKTDDLDPIGNILKRKFRLSPFKFGFIIFISNVLVDGWLGWHYNVFYSNSTVTGLLQDSVALSTDFLIEPLICGFFLWTIDGTTIMFNQLLNAEIFIRDQLVIEKMQSGARLFGDIRFFIIILVLSVTLTFSQVAGYMGWVPWRTLTGYLYLYPPMSFARIPFWFIAIYGLLYAICNITITILTLRLLFRDEAIRLIPLHPDGCAGLGSIGEYMTRIGYVVAPSGLYISLAVINEIRQDTLLVAYPVNWIYLYICSSPHLYISFRCGQFTSQCKSQRIRS